MAEEYRNVTVTGRTSEGIPTLAGEKRLGGPGSDQWVRFTGDADLLRIRMAFYTSDEAGDRLWATQDGMPGVDPNDASWDWSALRDSTPQARTAMNNIAREYVPDDALAAALGIDPSELA